MSESKPTGLVSPDGRPVSSRSLVECPRCGRGGNARSVQTFFGGWWTRVCQCGHVYDRGQGIPPLEE